VNEPIETTVWDEAQAGADYTVYVPVTPGGTILFNLAAKTEQEAIDNLLADAAHMPYDGWDSPDGYGFKQRGYEICETAPKRADDDQSENK